MALSILGARTFTFTKFHEQQFLKSGFHSSFGLNNQARGVFSSRRPCPFALSIFPVSVVSQGTEISGTEKSSAPRREVLGHLVAGAMLAIISGVTIQDAGAVSSSRRALRSEQVPDSEYKTLPNGLKYFDIKVGGGPAAVKGSRVAIHYVAKWKGLTFMTSRQGMGVTGGTPYGFDVGSSEIGIVLKGLDLGVQGMRVGGQRMLIVPPQLAYGNKGIQEIPPNATLEFNVELLSIKQSPFGSRVKVVEG